MHILPLAFYIFAALAIGFSISVLFSKNPVSSAFSLVMVFFSFAAIYAMMGAHMLAALQVLVYAGAIMVLFVFVIMLLNSDKPSFDLIRTHPIMRSVAMLVGCLCVGVFAWVFKSAAFSPKMGQFTQEKIVELGGNTQVISQILFSEYMLPFQLIAVLLLVGLIAAVAIAKRKLGNS